MAARRRTGSFSPNTSLRLRSSKVDMLLDIVFSVSDRRTGGPFKPGSDLSGDVHTSQSRANEQTRLSSCHGASTPTSQNPACRGPRIDAFSRERAESFHHFLLLPSPRSTPSRPSVAQGKLHLLTADASRRIFEAALERVWRRYRLHVYGYVVMPEHVHLLLNEPQRETSG